MDEEKKFKNEVRQFIKGMALLQKFYENVSEKGTV